MFAYNGSNTAGWKMTHVFRSVHQLAAPVAKSAVCATESCFLYNFFRGNTERCRTKPSSFDVILYNAKSHRQPISRWSSRCIEILCKICNGTNWIVHWTADAGERSTVGHLKATETGGDGQRRPPAAPRRTRQRAANGQWGQPSLSGGADTAEENERRSAGQGGRAYQRKQQTQRYRSQQSMAYNCQPNITGSRCALPNIILRDRFFWATRFLILFFPYFSFLGRSLD